MQKEDQNKLLHVVKEYIPKAVLSKKNKAKTWLYGYNEKYDFVNISKNGEVGEIVNINGLAIGIPKQPKHIHKRSDKKHNQYWERHEAPVELNKINSIFQWNQMSPTFKAKWIDYIEGEFDKRDEGYWLYNNGKPTYITGSHYMYL